MLDFNVVYPYLMEICQVGCLGAGYVGGPSMAVMAAKCPELLIKVLDVNPIQIEKWNSDSLPVYEPGL